MLSKLRISSFKRLQLTQKDMQESSAKWQKGQPVQKWAKDACVPSLFSRVQLYDPMDYSPPGSSVHGILQARLLKCVAMSSSRGSYQPRGRTCLFCLLHWQVLYHQCHLGNPGKGYTQTIHRRKSPSSQLAWEQTSSLTGNF